MDDRELRVLLIEDNPGDAGLIRANLAEARGGPFRLEWADRLGKGLDLLSKGGFDALLLDLSLPDSAGLDTVAAVRAKSPSIPIVVLTGLDDEETAARALQRGAQDYLVKGQVGADNLARSLRYSIVRKSLERLREDSLHNVNHELRTPLAAVYGALSIVKEEFSAQLAGQGAQFLDLALNGTRHLTRMTEDLAEALRAETGKLSVAPESAELAPLIRETVSFLGLSEKARGIALSCDVSPGLPPARVDPVRFRQVLLNLLGNALKFTPKGGAVKVLAGPSAGEEGFLRVSVSDNGSGIPPEALGRLFDRLYQVPGAAQTGKRGLGIGLYLCRELVSRHGGRIWVESSGRAGEGSVFHFTVPAA